MWRGSHWFSTLEGNSIAWDTIWRIGFKYNLRGKDVRVTNVKKILMEWRYALLILLSIYSSYQPFNKHSMTTLYQAVFSVLENFKSHKKESFCSHGAYILGRDSTEIFHSSYRSTFWRFSRSTELNWIRPKDIFMVSLLCYYLLRVSLCFCQH